MRLGPRAPQGRDPGHVVADGEALHPVSDGVDDPREVLARDDRETVLHHAPRHPRRDEDVEPVHRRRFHRDTDLAGSRIEDGDVLERGGAPVVRQCERPHRALRRHRSSH